MVLIVCGVWLVKGPHPAKKPDASKDVPEDADFCEYHADEPDNAALLSSPVVNKNEVTDVEQNTTNKPLRRVGTLTLGVCLIAAGTLFLLARFLPGLPWLVIWQVLPAAGLILLGCEVLYYSARPGACRCDFGSVVLCLLMMGGCFGVSTLMLLAQMLGRGCTIHL